MATKLYHKKVGDYFLRVEVREYATKPLVTKYLSVITFKGKKITPELSIDLRARFDELQTPDQVKSYARGLNLTGTGNE